MVGAHNKSLFDIYWKLTKSIGGANHDPWFHPYLHKRSRIPYFYDAPITMDS